MSRTFVLLSTHLHCMYSKTCTHEKENTISRQACLNIAYSFPNYANIIFHGQVLTSCVMVDRVHTPMFTYVTRRVTFGPNAQMTLLS